MLMNRISAFTAPISRVRGAGGDADLPEDQYGAGSVAYLRAPYVIEAAYTAENASGEIVNYPAKTAQMFRKGTSGNWTSQPGQLAYFSSLARLKERAAVERVDRVAPPAQDDGLFAPPPPQYATTDHLETGAGQIDMPGPEADAPADTGMPPASHKVPDDAPPPPPPPAKAQEAAKGISKGVMIAGAGALAVLALIYFGGKKSRK